MKQLLNSKPDSMSLTFDIQTEFTLEYPISKSSKENYINNELILLMR